MSHQLTPTTRALPSGTAVSGTAHLAVGAVFGLAWAAGLRAYMAGMAGAESAFSWGGTFLAILVPGVMTGTLLGWAEYLRRTGGRRHLRLLVLSPVVLAIAPLLQPGALRDLLTEGLGGGAIGLAVIGIGGGFALSGRGRAAWRATSGVVAALLVVGVATAPSGVGGTGLALTTPRGAWIAVLGLASGLTLAVACSIPLRRAVPLSAPPAVAPLPDEVGPAGSSDVFHLPRSST